MIAQLPPAPKVDDVSPRQSEYGITLRGALNFETRLIERIELVEPYLSDPDVTDNESTQTTITA